MAYKYYASQNVDEYSISYDILMKILGNIDNYKFPIVAEVQILLGEIKKQSKDG